MICRLAPGEPRIAGAARPVRSEIKRVTVMPYQIPPKARPIVEGLAEAVLPINLWLGVKGPPANDRFLPPLTDVPSRLSTVKMEVADYLELLIDASEEALAHRWRDRRKGLNAAAKFGAFDPTSNNFAFLSGTAPDGTPKETVSRREFYDACWPPLIATCESKPPNDLASWNAFRDLLRNDLSALWPPTTPIKSSAFVTQFTIDVLRACLGQRNAALKDPAWQRAVLIEVGENRNPKNAYTVEQAKAAVDAFLKLIPA
jgi:hypothetical protein